jgi:transcriptional regulator NrdR family protein
MKCPKCGSNDTDCLDSDGGDGQITEDWYCAADGCGTSWEATYRLFGLRIIEDDSKPEEE